MKFLCGIILILKRNFVSFINTLREYYKIIRMSGLFLWIINEYRLFLSHDDNNISCNIHTFYVELLIRRVELF